MASLPFPGTWPTNSKLTGNAEFVVAPSGGIWLVGNRSSTGAAIFLSLDHGLTFNQVTTIYGLASSTTPFDPAVCLDSSGVLHFIGQLSDVNGIHVAAYTFNTSTYVQSGPFLISSGGIVGADYDIAALNTGNCLVVGATLTASTETLFWQEITAAGSVAAHGTIAPLGTTEPTGNQPLLSGSRIGSVSLLSVDGVHVEVYLGQHQKLVAFGDISVTITQASYTTAGGVTASRLVTQFMARSIDNRLTVVPSGLQRFLSQAYYTQAGGQLACNALLGYLSGAVGTPWVFTRVKGTPTASVTQPTISTTPAGVSVGYIVADLTQSPPEDGLVQVCALNTTTMTLSPHSQYHLTQVATLLRGTQMALPTTTPWNFFAVRFLDQAAFFLTGYDTPPTAIITPSTLTALRGITYTLDASQSTSSNLDPLTYQWYSSNTQIPITPSPSGLTATFAVPYAIGAAALSFTVTLEVTAFDNNGVALHPSSSTMLTIYVPAITPPSIAVPSVLTAARNSNVTLAPTCTISPEVTASFVWVQTSGTPMTVVTKAETLVFSTAGAGVQGETLTFTLFVSDGINATVSCPFDVVVPAAGAYSTSTGLLLNRSSWSGTIAQRNTSGTWGALMPTTLHAAFTSAKRVMLTNGRNSRIFIEPTSVTAWSQNQDFSAHEVRRVFLPDSSATILDAVQTEGNSVITLSSNGSLQFLHRFDAAPLISTDSPSGIITLSGVDYYTYTILQANAAVNGIRMLILGGPDGCLLIEVSDSAFVVQGTLHLNRAASLLYGGDNVEWIRTSNVDSLTSGFVLIGSTDTVGNNCETLVDLSQRHITGIWDSSQLRNTTVTTGEFVGASGS